METIPWPYIHITINHFPIVLAALGMVATISASLMRRRAVWLYSVATLSAAAVMVGPVFLTGDQADDFLRDPWYVRPGVIDTHKDAALVSLVLILLVGLLAAWSWRDLVRRGEGFPSPAARVALLIGSIVSFASVTYTAFLGGRIIHEAPVLTLPAAPAGMPSPERAGVPAK